MRSVIMLIFIAVAWAAGAQVSIDEIQKSLSCSCGCGMTVEACEGAMSCQAAASLTEEAQQLIAQGLGKEQVLNMFVARHGEQILAAPTKEGFNLTAWVLPFAGIFTAGFGIALALRRWVGPTAPTSGAPKDRAKPEDGYEKQLDDVLRALD